MNSENNIKVSVIVPVHNAQEFLTSALEDIIDQTLKDIEIICVDDGSDDNSLEILKHYSEIDERIIVLTQSNINAGAARNRGLSIAKGEYLSFLDADDMFEKDMLEKAYSMAKKKDADIIVYRSDSFDNLEKKYINANWTIRKELLPEDKSVFSYKDVEEFFYCISGYPWDKMIRREMVEDNLLSFQEIKAFNDMYFIQCTMASAKRISIIEDILVHKRINVRNAITTSYGEKKSDDLFNALLEMKNFLIRNEMLELIGAWENYAAHYVVWNLDRYKDACVDIKEWVYTFEKNWVEKHLSVPDMRFHRKIEKNIISLMLSAKDYKTFMWDIALLDKGGIVFPYELVPKGAKVVLYGAGKIGIEYYKQIVYTGFCELIMWIDRAADDRGTFVRNVSCLREIGDSYEYLVIAIENEKMQEEIREEVRGMGVNANKIVWRAPRVFLDN